MSMENPLISAIQHKEFGSIRKLVKNDINFVNKQDINGDTPLHHAVRLAQAYELDGNTKAASQYQAIANYLVIKGEADISIKNNSGESIDPLIEPTEYLSQEKFNSEMLGGRAKDSSKLEVISQDSINVDLNESIDSDSVYAILSSDFINDVFGNEKRDESPTFDKMLGGGLNQKISKDKLSSVSSIDSALELSLSTADEFSIDSFGYAPEPTKMVGGESHSDSDSEESMKSSDNPIDISKILSLNNDDSSENTDTDVLVNKLARLHAKYNKKASVKQSRKKRNQSQKDQKKQKDQKV